MLAVDLVDLWYSLGSSHACAAEEAALRSGSAFSAFAAPSIRRMSPMRARTVLSSHRTAAAAYALAVDLESSRAVLWCCTRPRAPASFSWGNLEAREEFQGVRFRLCGVSVRSGGSGLAFTLAGLFQIGGG